MKNRAIEGNLNNKKLRIMIYLSTIIVLIFFIQITLLITYNPNIQTSENRVTEAENVEDRIETQGEIWNSYSGGYWVKDCHEGSRSVIGITAVIEFEEPMNRTSVDYTTVVQLDNKSWKLSEQYKPFTMIWDENNKTLTLSFPVHYLKQTNPHRINYTVNSTAKTLKGDTLGGDYNSFITIGPWVELSVNQKQTENIHVSFPTWYWYLLIFFTFLLIIIFFVLFFTIIKKRKKNGAF